MLSLYPSCQDSLLHSLFHIRLQMHLQYRCELLHQILPLNFSTVVFASRSLFSSQLVVYCVQNFGLQCLSFSGRICNGHTDSLVHFSRVGLRVFSVQQPLSYLYHLQKLSLLRRSLVSLFLIMPQYTRSTWNRRFPYAVWHGRGDLWLPWLSVQPLSSGLAHIGWGQQSSWLL